LRGIALLLTETGHRARGGGLITHRQVKRWISPGGLSHASGASDDELPRSR
jgi:hypothetical protein